MKIKRLLEITLILLNKNAITAGELAARFNVSTRTIYRDIDELSSAGVPVFTNKGSGDETAKAWETFMKMNKVNPLKNQAGEEGYEIRMYPNSEDPGDVHVGVAVKDASVPAEYKVMAIPAFKYAEFKIYPSKGFGSSNPEMNNWLRANENVSRGSTRQKRVRDRGLRPEVQG